jgi:hypothetical protein
MKALIYTTTAIAVTGLVGVLFAGSAHAQLPERLQFDTSFSFNVGNTHFGPGHYLIGPADDNNDGVLRISNGRQAAFMVIVPEGVPANEPKDNELTFERFGDSYVLTQIWDATDQLASEPSTVAEMRRHEPQHKLAERITVPFVKMS